MEGGKESDRDCSSWCSLLGAGSVFGSAHCIISISTNLPEQTGKGQTCSASCIMKSFCLHAFSHAPRQGSLYPLRSVTQASPCAPAIRPALININTHCVSLGGTLNYVKAFISPPSSVAGIVSVLCKRSTVSRKAERAAVAALFTDCWLISNCIFVPRPRQSHEFCAEQLVLSWEPECNEFLRLAGGRNRNLLCTNK